MKTRSYPEVEALLAEIRQLRLEVEDLQARLQENDEEEDENRWAIWPYSWIVGGWEKTQGCLHSFQLKAARRNLKKHNARSRRSHQSKLKLCEANTTHEAPAQFMVM